MGRATQPHWQARGRTILGQNDPIPKVMGVVNQTPDSFSDGGSLAGRDEAVSHAQRLVREGAGLIDLGGESSRPGSEPVALEEELRRVIPVVEAMAAELGVPISIDTTKAEVARRALAAGAAIVNDISALAADPEMGRVVASTDAGVVLMHMQGVPKTMQVAPHYEDVVSEVYDAPGAAAGVGRVDRDLARSDRHRPGDRLRQDLRAQPGDLAEAPSI